MEGPNTMKLAPLSKGFLICLVLYLTRTWMYPSSPQLIGTMAFNLLVTVMLKTEVAEEEFKVSCAEG